MFVPLPPIALGLAKHVERSSAWQACCIFAMQSPENIPKKHHLFYLCSSKMATSAGGNTLRAQDRTHSNVAVPSEVLQRDFDAEALRSLLQAIQKSFMLSRCLGSRCRRLRVGFQNIPSFSSICVVGMPSHGSWWPFLACIRSITCARSTKRHFCKK